MKMLVTTMERRVHVVDVPSVEAAKTLFETRALEDEGSLFEWHDALVEIFDCDTETVLYEAQSTV